MPLQKMAAILNINTFFLDFLGSPPYNTKIIAEIDKICLVYQVDVKHKQWENTRPYPQVLSPGNKVIL